MAPDTAATVIQTATGHEHHVRSGTCGRGEHGRCRRRSQYDAKCVYICTCVCHRGGVVTNSTPATAALPAAHDADPAGGTQPGKPAGPALTCRRCAL